MINPQNSLASLLQGWPLRRIGKVSYGIYLYHMLTLHFVSKGLKLVGIESLFPLFAGTLLATWSLAELSYYYFEARFLALKGVPDRTEAPASARM